MSNYVKNIYDVLDEVYRGGAFSQIRLNEEIVKNPDNSSLITKVVYGVLDNDLYLQNFISQLASKKPKPQICLILKIGIYMLKFLNVPNYAVVNNLVELTKDIGKKQLSGFVNSVLKNSINFNPTYPDNHIEAVSIKKSFPLWFVEKLFDQYGNDSAEDILEYKMREDAHIRRADCIDSRKFEKLLMENDVKFEKSCVENGYYVSHNSIECSELPKKYYVTQSASSILVCDAMNPHSNSKVLDVCAAPGGKSIYLSEKCCNGSIVSCDFHEHRVRLVDKYIKRMSRNNIETKCIDATVFYPEFSEAFDYVLTDVPCSGFGVIGSKPDIKLKRTYDDVLKMQHIQKSILSNCSRYVKKGGYIVYSTCTVLREENQDVVEDFLKSNKGFLAEDFTLSIQPKIKYGKFVQLLPAFDGVEGFFIAKLKRRE